MFSSNARKFLFKCEDCEMIMAVEFEDQEDLDKVQDDKMFLECPCDGICKILRD